MLLDLNNLTIEFHDRGICEQVVKELSFQMEQGQILGMVGESGSGKTMTALALMGLLKSHAQIRQGSMYVLGQDFFAMKEDQKTQMRGNQISMIFQEPMTALNPAMRIGKQVEESLRLHTDFGKQKRKARVLEVLEEVELENPQVLYDKYPHQLSGGMRQRVMIASAIVTNPKLLIADEPTTALDVYTQIKIIKLLKKINKTHNMGILFISHNLRVVKELCTQVLVMKEGVVVECGQTENIFENPKEAYTKALLEAIPTRVSDNPYLEWIIQRNGEVHV